MTTAGALRFQGVAAGYGRRRVVEDVTATAGPGRITVLLGPNAAGKTTLLRCATGSLRCTAGAVTVDGAPVHRLHGRRLAQRMAWVPQRPEVFGAFTVREVVEAGRYAMGHDPARVDAVLAELELARIAGQPFPSLSAGQQQRVALARALAQHVAGAALVLDEPVASMDLGHAREAFRHLRRRADEGAVVLMVLHDLTAAARIADDAWILVPEGPGEATGVSRMLATGPVDDVVTPDRLRAVFGGRFEWLTRADGSAVLVPPPIG